MILITLQNDFYGWVEELRLTQISVSISKK